MQNYKRLLSITRYQLQHWQLLFKNLQQRLQHPQQRLQQQAQKLDELEHRLITSCHNKLHWWQQKVTQTTSILTTLSPLATLQRGYAIVSHKQNI